MPKLNPSLIKQPSANTPEITGAIPGNLKIMLLGVDGADSNYWSTVANFNTGGVNLSHSGLTDLDSDDHLQYHTPARANAWLGTKTTANLEPTTDRQYASQTEKDDWDATALNFPRNTNPPADAAVRIERQDGTEEHVQVQDLPGGGGGVTDHGQLTGLTNDDHNSGPNAYHTDARAGLWLAGQGLAATGITGAEIKVSYEAEPNTNAYTDAEKTKLAGIEVGATADQTGAEIKVLYEGEPNTNAFTDAEKAYLASIGTPADLAAVYESNPDTNKYTDGDVSKLAGIEPGAQVNDVATVFGLTGAVTIGSLTDTVAPLATDSIVFEQASTGNSYRVPINELPGVGVTNHGSLTGLGADDHLQYHTDVRASAWLGLRTLGELGTLDAGGKPITNVGTVGGANMANVPTTNEKAALSGASTGTAPTGANPFVASDDTRVSYSDTRDPLNTDDDTATPPFAVGSRWVNTATDDEFVCTGAPTGAATWIKTTETIGALSHSSLQDLGNDDHPQYHTDARGDARYAPITHPSDTNNPHAVTKAQVGLDNVENTKVNQSTSNPAPTDDVNDGYSVHSRWINPNTDREFVCLDAAEGAAVWVETTNNDHSNLENLGLDTHPQYLTEARGDARYRHEIILKDSGALGDGATDDGVAFDTFIAAAIASDQLEGRVTAGHYKITSASGQYVFPSGFKLVLEEGAILEWTKDPDTAPIDPTSVFAYAEGSNIAITGGEFRNCGFVLVSNQGTLYGFRDTFSTTGPISNNRLEDCKLTKCIEGMYIRSAGSTKDQTSSGYQDVDDIVVRNVEAEDSCGVLWSVCTSSHRWVVEGNRGRILNNRPLNNVTGFDRNCYAVLMGPINQAPYAQIAQITERSGYHQIINNNFASIDVTGAHSAGTSVEIRDIRVTCQNICAINGNTVGPISCPNFPASPGADELNIAHIYGKIIGAQYNDNNFYGPIQSDLATNSSYLRVKGDGLKHQASPDETRGWGSKIMGNNFYGTGERTALNTVIPIAIYSDLTIAQGNHFEDLNFPNFRGGISLYGSSDQSEIDGNTFIRCGVPDGAIAGAVAVQEGGVGLTISNIHCIQSVPDGVGSRFHGVYGNFSSGPDRDIVGWRINNIMMSEGGAVSSAYVELAGSGRPIDITDLQITGCGGDNVNKSRAFWISGFAGRTLTNVVLKDNDFSGISTLFQNPDGLVFDYIDADTWYTVYNSNLVPIKDLRGQKIFRETFATDTSLSPIMLGDRMAVSTGATATNFTFDPDSTLDLPIGSWGVVKQEGAGLVTFAAGSGVTLNPSPGTTLVSAGQNAQMTWVKDAANTYTLGGNLALQAA